MLDPAVLRRHPGAVRDMAAARGGGFDAGALIAAEAARRAASARADGLRRRRNEIGRAISAAKASGAGAAGLISEMAGVSAEMGPAEEGLRRAEAEYSARAMAAPNLLHASVPRGPAGAWEEVRRWGEPGGPARGHMEVCERLGIADVARAARVSGSRFYYMVGDLVRLNRALIAFAMDYLDGLGYTPVQPPYMIGRGPLEGAAVAADLEGAVYKVEGEDLYMIGTSEHALAAMHSGETLPGGSLPVRYSGFSPCFRREAGAHGRDQKGLFRVHQFDKVEQFALARPGESWAEHERMLSAAEGFYRRLGLPHRTVVLPSGDTGAVSAKTYDVEAWMAAQGAYREVVSCSNCLDYQARRLGVRFRDSPSGPSRHVHTLNCTLAATSRVLVAIIEGFQGADGHVSVPKALRPYAGIERLRGRGRPAYGAAGRCAPAPGSWPPRPSLAASTFVFVSALNA